MVILSRTLCFATAWRPKKRYLRSKFLDSLKIHVLGGVGGSGLPQYGGIGGQGGCVYCIGKEGQFLRKILDSFPEHEIRAGNGEASRKKKMFGSPGTDVELEVPLGVTVFADNIKIGEINNEGDTCILARGGPGGTKDNNFIGYEGQKRPIILDLKLIADVGFVGFPNAGKSTLLKALSKAKPKIANYPFTTIRPNLGTVHYPDLRKITLADLPGLIEGAHKNIGLGHNFLKHVERTKILLLIADVQGFKLSVEHPLRTCFETVLLLNKEIEMYNPEILKKPAMLLINKMDTENAKKIFDEVKEKLINVNENLSDISPGISPTMFLDFEEIIGISALENDGIKKVKNTIRDLIDKYQLFEEEEAEQAIDELGERLIERGPKFT